MVLFLGLQEDCHLNSNSFLNKFEGVYQWICPFGFVIGWLWRMWHVTFLRCKIPWSEIALVTIGTNFRLNRKFVPIFKKNFGIAYKYVV